MKKRNVFISYVLCLASFSLQAQDCSGYFLSEKNKKIITANYSPKGDEESRFETEVVHVENTTDGTLYTLKVSAGSIVNELELLCSGGAFSVEMSPMLDPKMMEAYQKMEVRMEADNLEFPADLSPGKLLPGSNVVMTVSNQGNQLMKMVFTATNRKVEKLEKVETPAGIFDCVKVISMVTSDMGMMKVTIHMAEWYTRGLGMVRSEMYNQKMELEGYAEVIEIN